ncbi:MAG: diguanylate cyclase [Thermoguttaceae bacterium]
MAKTPGPNTESLETPAKWAAPDTFDPPYPPLVATDFWVSEIGTLLQELEEPSEVAETVVSAGPVPATSEAVDNQLAQVRLGIGGALFAALRCKHEASARHALRVALNCSVWSLKMGLGEDRRDALEVAALLHDIGIIGVPDRVLLKPGMLDSDEAATMARSRRMSLEILRHCCVSQEILDIVEHVGARSDGTRQGYRLCGEDIPLAARMISLVEAFDAMVTDRVYRSAISHERAMAELFDCAGSQFDAELVNSFAEFHSCDQSQLREEVTGRWLNSLDPDLVNSYWQLNFVPLSKNRPSDDLLFETKLLDNMYDAVVFIDASGQIQQWNRGAERLTGIGGSSVVQRRWDPSLLHLSDEKGRRVAHSDCPVRCAIRSGTQSLRRMTICGRSERPISVDTHAIPVLDDNGSILGVILLFHDASSEISLEQRCQSLHEKATKDPMTQVANRAEFDRVHATFAATHQQQQVPCALMICDLDRFKNVNDTFGHQAGDEVIRAMANLLKSSCRPGDLVARYGGEEFVMLCADCDNTAATRRAEEIRKRLAQMPQSMMEGRAVTVSFGVTEIQPGDTPETMLRRADRALLMAKSRGRNQVVQLGTGPDGEASEDGQPRETTTGASKIEKTDSKQLLEQVLITSVPVKMAIEKLRGFVADHRAKILKINGNHVSLEIVEQYGTLRRLTDRPIAFRVDLCFLEEQPQTEGDASVSGSAIRTRIELKISLRKARDRRRMNVENRAREVITSFRSYLMATNETNVQMGVVRRAKQILAPWLTRK